MRSSQGGLTAGYLIRHVSTVVLPVAAPGAGYAAPVGAGELVHLTMLGWGEGQACQTREQRTFFSS